MCVSFVNKRKEMNTCPASPLVSCLDASCCSVENPQKIVGKVSKELSQ